MRDNKKCLLDYPVYLDSISSAEQLRTELRAQWFRENADAIQAYNQFVETNCTLSDSVRKF